MTGGLLILLFTGFQLWGTGVAEARAQSALDAEFEDRLQRFRQLSQPDDPTIGEEPLSQTDRPEPPVPLPAQQIPEFGDAAGRVVIPAIGVNKAIVHGVARDDLRKGPGHYPTSPLPGQPGNAAIAGHRTTHGAPFFDLDQLKPGDEITVETLQGRFIYVVEAHDNGSGIERGHFIVPPTATEVLEDQGDDRLTLTACHPKYSAAQRIIVTATLTSTPAPATPIPFQDITRSEESELAAEPGTEVSTEIDTGIGTEDGTEIEDPVLDAANAHDGGDDSLGWRPEHAKPAALWAAATALMALGAWLSGRRWRRIPTYVMAAAPVGGSLFMCFTHLDKFLPAV